MDEKAERAYQDAWCRQLRVEIQKREGRAIQGLDDLKQAEELEAFRADLAAREARIRELDGLDL